MQWSLEMENKGWIVNENNEDTSLGRTEKSEEGRSSRCCILQGINET